MNLLGQVWYLGKNKQGESESERERERESQFAHPHSGIVPSLETFENVMKVSQMIIQGMWSRGSNSCLFQMPHITFDQVKHFRTKKVSSSNHVLIFLICGIIFVHFSITA